MRSTALALSLTLALLAGAAPATAQATEGIDPRIMGLLEEVSADNMAEYLRVLTDFETRHTMSVDLGPDRGIVPAREYILETFRGFSPRLDASLDCYTIPPQGRIPGEVDLCNVMAVLPGRSDRRVYVSGHYDTVARREDTGSFDWTRWDNPAPGANDDGSGTVLTMELARVFAQSGLEFDATLVFIALAAEEEGLVGATLHAQRAAEEETRIDAVFNNDIIGNSVGGNGIVDGRTVRVFSEGPMDSPSRQMARFIRRQAGRYVPGHEVRLIAREDRFGRGGDHTAFNRLGYAGVRFSESRENYARQHEPADTWDGVDFEYLARNARVNAAAVATVALAPAAPVIDTGRGPMLGRGESGYDAHLRWQESDGAVGYRIVWREAWTPDWQHELTVGPGTEHVLPDISIDDYIFGIAAIGPGGHESLVSPYVRAPRGFTRVEEVGR
ncbi:MAG TPA: M20/M25/M40 family metallo-hydrolase [Longimicrobiales bacterium]|nr:M20/M25/M40 family metallo-hydrolase [Longimicrobiales bacterium]